MPQPPEPPPLQSIETADALYTRVLARGRRLRRERRAFLATAAMSFVLLAAAVPVALTNDDGSQVATTDRTRPTRPATTSTTAAPRYEYNFDDTPSTTVPSTAPVVQGTTATTARPKQTATTRRAAPPTTTATTRPPSTAPSTTSTTVVPNSAPASACTPSTPSATAARGRVLFVRAGDIFVADLTTQPPTVVNLTESPGTESSPAWSPDGTAFVFVRDGALFTMAVSSPPGSAAQITTGPGDSAPAWSWDGSTIAFARAGNIWLVPSGGTAATKAIDVADPLGDPTWSPDGCRLAYTWRGAVLASRTDGTGMIRVQDRASEPAWSRGNRLAVTVLVGQTRDVFVGNPTANAAFTRVTTGGATTPSWSASADRIVFQTTRNGNADIYAIDAGGGALEPVATDPADEISPAW